MKLLMLTSDNNQASSLISWLMHVCREDVHVLKQKVTLETLHEIKPEFIISYNYRHIVSQDVIKAIFPKIINLHVSYLPWNKGSHPNIWSIVDNTPKGVTIHQIDSGVDTGAILVQEKVAIDEDNDSLASSYEKLHKAIQDLFKRNWDDIKSNRISAKPQLLPGTKHFLKDFEWIRPTIDQYGWDLSIRDFKTHLKSAYRP